ncbi:unnamed protein product [Allacma fusca]|uniref:Uncharacterized protein n=1 Tax=Allacma fusca TaxID=39272 RepID=A0A8J2J0K3_9HEXA|nr:unnamed protein product [Allacma fusca]
MTDNAQGDVGAFGKPEDIHQDAIHDEDDLSDHDEEQVEDDINWEEYTDFNEDEFEAQNPTALEEECEASYENICDWSKQELIPLGCVNHALQLVVKECPKKHPRSNQLTLRGWGHINVRTSWHNYSYKLQCGDGYMSVLRTSLCLTITERFGEQEQFNYSGRGARKCLREVFGNEAYILVTVLDPRWQLTSFKIPLPETYKLKECVPSVERVKNILVSTHLKEKSKTAAVQLIEVPAGQTDARSSPKRNKMDFLSSFIPSDNDAEVSQL